MEKKRIIVCGDRFYTNYRRVESSLREEREWIELCINGGGKGADLFADSACSVLRIPKERMDAKWREQGLGAGPIRNQKMLSKLKVQIRDGGQARNVNGQWFRIEKFFSNSDKDSVVMGWVKLGEELKEDE